MTPLLQQDHLEMNITLMFNHLKYQCHQVICFTHLSFGMMLRLGTGWWTPIRGSVFCELLPRSYLADLGQFFSSKSTCHIHTYSVHWRCGERQKNLTPQIRGFLRAISLFQNQGTFSKIEGQRLCLWLAHSYIGAPLNSGKYSFFHREALNSSSNM